MTGQSEDHLGTLVRLTGARAMGWVGLLPDTHRWVHSQSLLGFCFCFSCLVDLVTYDYFSVVS